MAVHVQVHLAPEPLRAVYQLRDLREQFTSRPFPVDGPAGFGLDCFIMNLIYDAATWRLPGQ